MTRFSVSRAWTETSATIARDFRLHTAIAGALVLAPRAIAALLNPMSAADPTGAGEAAGAAGGGGGGFIMIVALALQVAALVAMARLALPPTLTVGQAIGRGIKRMPQQLLATLIAVLPLFAAMIATVRYEASPSGGLALVSLLLFVAAMWVMPRLSLTAPIAAAEEGWAVTLLQRSWAMTRGHYWRLLAMLMLFGAGLILCLWVVTMLASTMVGLADGTAIEPMSGAALAMGLAVGLVQALATAISAVLFARCYVQLTAPPASVPDVDR